MKHLTIIRWAFFSCVFIFSFPSLVLATSLEVQVTVENLSQPGGTFLTPFWIGLHDGSFDLFDFGAPIGTGNSASTGQPLPSGLEALVEDGDTAPLRSNFAGSTAGQNGGIDFTLPGSAGVPGVIDPGERVTSQILTVDPVKNRYLSFVSMVIPSNDAFIANELEVMCKVFDENGNFLGINFIVLGGEVVDAGTEENTEVDAAFLNQLGPNTGVDENGVAHVHPGFNGSVGSPAGSPVNILGATTAGPGDITIDQLAADFTRAGYQVAHVHLAPVKASSRANPVPEPSTILLLGSGVLSMGMWRWKTLKRAVG